MLSAVTERATHRLVVSNSFQEVFVQRIKSLCPCFSAIICLGLSVAPAHAQSSLLPFDSSNHVWYDNDFANDYVDWYLMAVATSGEIVLRGITTSSSGTEWFDQLVAMRARVVADGRASGFRNVPQPLPGANRPLAIPVGGQIDDTEPAVSAGTAALIAEAHRTYAETGKPLVVCVGGPLTGVASAYLRDPSIANKIVVSFIDNYETMLGGYNGQSDPWAAYIVLRRLQLVYFPAYPGDRVGPFPRLSKDWIKASLPPSPARDHMLSLKLDVVNGTDGDGDGMTAVSLLTSNYVRAVRRVSFGGWVDANGNGRPPHVPIMTPDDNGTALVVTHADGDAASAEYRRAFLNLSIWADPVAGQNAPSAP
jgi:hypothetical protein